MVFEMKWYMCAACWMRHAEDRDTYKLVRVCIFVYRKVGSTVTCIAKTLSSSFVPLSHHDTADAQRDHQLRRTGAAPPPAPQRALAAGLVRRRQRSSGRSPDPIFLLWNNASSVGKLKQMLGGSRASWSRCWASFLCKSRKRVADAHSRRPRLGARVLHARGRCCTLRSAVRALSRGSNGRSVSHSISVMCGAFVRARRALSSQALRLPTPVSRRRRHVRGPPRGAAGPTDQDPAVPLGRPQRRLPERRLPDTVHHGQ